MDLTPLPPKPQQQQYSQSSFELQKLSTLPLLLEDLSKFRRQQQNPYKHDNNLTNTLLLMHKVLSRLNSRMERADDENDRLTFSRKASKRAIPSPPPLVPSAISPVAANQEYDIHDRIEHVFNDRMRIILEKFDLNLDNLRNSIERLKLFDELLHDKMNSIIDKLQDITQERQQSQQELRIMVDSIEKNAEQGTEETVQKETA
ncbi:unnamed protein product [Didymodactylos carnosus]|uniref:Uncharacterized protein n=1 Tax=Didymodactylos carnosus TaxID=1234261 RepID=A0A815XU10_9BILA|nr:unnamed protein product [Didymodactylos carnosus]CAF1561778.1 unnamed protein product [Didymodactylos carnosus]CAF4257243.1 unnamed protein product [Didymodactylos carnosus]CAF4423348.1 unnamed protein product [Didymodactylos carnosus]